MTDPKDLNPVCLFHGMRRSEHACLYCSLCYRTLRPDECWVDESGEAWDVCEPCHALEQQRMAACDGEQCGVCGCQPTCHEVGCSAAAGLCCQLKPGDVVRVVFKRSSGAKMLNGRERVVLKHDALAKTNPQMQAVYLDQQERATGDVVVCGDEVEVER